MKSIVWDIDKNELLKETRNICFEDIVYHIENGHIKDIIDNPNQEKYTDQKLFLIEINNYIYMVPFDETAEHYLLKTIIPSRKMTKKYLGV
jgi:hypothetical protein